MMWDVVYADGELHELEDNTLWRVAELIGVDRRDRIAMRQEAAAADGGRTPTRATIQRRRQNAGRERRRHEDPDRAASGTVERRAASGSCCSRRASTSISAGRRSATPCPTRCTVMPGAVVFGGPMSANDRTNFVRRETEWLKVPLREDKPFLGICLGAQMLVNHLGGKVEGHRTRARWRSAGIRCTPRRKARR